jgi:predicted DNA-binding transcriptional regulator AlpA
MVSPDAKTGVIAVLHHLDKRAADLIAAGAGSPDDLLTTIQVAVWLGMRAQTLEIWRCQGKGPPFVRLGPRCVRYKRSIVLAWLFERKCASTAEYRTVSKTSRRGRTNGRR